MTPEPHFSRMSCPCCSGPFEFPVEGQGRSAPCPHCQKEVTLAATVEPKPAPPLLWWPESLIAGGILAAYLGFRLASVLSISAAVEFRSIFDRPADEAADYAQAVLLPYAIVLAFRYFKFYSRRHKLSRPTKSSLVAWLSANKPFVQQQFLFALVGIALVAYKIHGYVIKAQGDLIPLVQRAGELNAQGNLVQSDGYQENVVAEALVGGLIGGERAMTDRMHRETERVAGIIEDAQQTQAEVVQLDIMIRSYRAARNFTIGFLVATAGLCAYLQMSQNKIRPQPA